LRFKFFPARLLMPTPPSQHTIRLQAPKRFPVSSLVTALNHPENTPTQIPLLSKITLLNVLLLLRLHRPRNNIDHSSTLRPTPFLSIPHLTILIPTMPLHQQCAQSILSVHLPTTLPHLTPMFPLQTSTWSPHQALPNLNLAS